MTEHTPPSVRGYTAWEHFRLLPLRRKVLVVVGAPLWLPIAFAAWLDAEVPRV